MPKTLHEFATSLQESIIKQQEDAHNMSSLNINKYNNLKLKMDSTIHYPHVIVAIGISEATFNIKDVIKTEGGLGPDERYVKKWLSSTSVIYELNELYNTFGDLIDAKKEEQDDNPNTYLHKEGEAEELKIEAPRSVRRKHETGFITVEEDMEEQMSKDSGLEVELEASTNENSGNVRLNGGYNLESIENIKKDLRKFLNPSFGRFRK